MGRHKLWTQTQLYFINGNVNVERYRDEVLRPIVVPFIHRHHLMSQGSVHNSWKLKMSQFSHYHEPCHPLTIFGMLWMAVYDSVVQYPPISSHFAQPLKRSGTTCHRLQSIAWSRLCEGDVSHCMGQMVVTPDTSWYLYDWYLYSQSCKIHWLWPKEYI